MRWELGQGSEFPTCGSRDHCYCMVWQKCDVRAEFGLFASNITGPGCLSMHSGLHADRQPWKRARSDHSGVTLHSLILLLLGGLCSPQHGRHLRAKAGPAHLRFLVDCDVGD